MQRMAKQGHTVVTPIFTLHMELTPYFHVLALTTHIILVDVGRIDNIHTRLVEVGHIRRIDRCGNPTLTEVEVQVLEGNRCRHGILQGFQRLLYLVVDFTTVGFNASFDGLDLLDHVSGNELVAYLIVTSQRIEEYLPVQFADEVILRLVRQFRHIAEIYPAVFVERCRHGLLCGLYMSHLTDRERNRPLEDVSLDKLAVLTALQRQHIPASCIHQDHLGIGFLVQATEAHTELVVVRVEVGA